MDKTRVREPNLDRFAQGPRDPQNCEPDDEIYTHCYICGNPIYYGDAYYEIDGEPMCEINCLLEMVDGKRKIAGDDC